MGDIFNDEQRAIFEDLVSKFGESKSLTEVDKARIRVLACVEWEMGRLQRFVNQHGPTYQVVGKSGDTYSRARPEYQQLQECRQRHSVILDKLNNDNATADSASTFIAL